jgi:hypothetical protein
VIKDLGLDSRFSSSTEHLDARLRIDLQYAAEDLIDGHVGSALEADLRAAGVIAHRRVFTDELIAQLTEAYAAAFEGALKGRRYRRLIDGETAAPEERTKA